MTKLLFQSSCVGLMAGLMSVAAALPASALSFGFSFGDGSNSRPTVTGEVRGLVDNATSSATSVEVLTNSGGFGVGEYVGNPSNNTFTVTNGVITNFDFFVEGVDNSAPAVTDSSLFLASLLLGDDGLTFSGGIINDPNIEDEEGIPVARGLTFEPIPEGDPIPTPAMLPGLVGMGVAAYRKRKFAQADA